MTDKPYPAHIRDNPIMQGAFAAFVRFADGRDDFHAAHQAETGLTRIPEPRSQIDAMIDKASGADKGREAYTASFVDWVIRNHWGVEGQDEDEIGCDYCQNDGTLTPYGTCPECDAEYCNEGQPND